MENPINDGEMMEKLPIRDERGRIVSGVLNPNGKPLGTDSFKTKWYKMIDKIASQNNLSPDEIDQQLLLVGYKKAKDGDYSFYRDAMDRIHGKPVQPTEIDMKGELTLKVVKYGTDDTA